MSLVKKALLYMIAKLAWLTGISAPKKRGADRLTIVTFHRVLPEEAREGYPYPGLAVTPEELDWFLAYFKEHYDVGSVTHQYRKLKEQSKAKEHSHPSKPQEKPLLAISFDDGQYDNYRYAAPLLSKHELKATFYIPTSAVNNATIIWHDQMGYALNSLERTHADSALKDIASQHQLDVDNSNQWVETVKHWPPKKRHALVTDLLATASNHAIPDWGRLMTWDEIRALHAQGHEIGSHSVNHHLMDQLDASEIEYEATASLHTLEEEIANDIVSFCYPNGNHDERCRNAMKKAKYDNAVTTRWGRNTMDQDRYALLRCDIDAKRFYSPSGELSRARTAFRLGGLQPGLEP